MVATDRVRALFADARDLQADALEMLEQGRIRNAAEKAWGATKRATDALALARTGEGNRSGPQRAPLASGCWNPSTQRYEGHAWCAATTHGRATCRGTASTPASASPSRRLSGGSGRRPTTSTTPSVWLIDTTNNLPQPWSTRGRSTPKETWRPSSWIGARSMSRWSRARSTTRPFSRALRIVAPRGALELLTEREREMLRLFLGGMTYEQIGEVRNVRAVTVRNAVSGAQRKLGFKTRQEMVLWGVRAGLMNYSAS